MGISQVPKLELMVGTTSDKLISVFNDYDFLKKSAFFKPLLNTAYWLKNVMESFTILTAMADYIILYCFPQQHFEKWLGTTCNCIWAT